MRSKRYQDLKKQISPPTGDLQQGEKNKTHALDEAVDLIKKITKGKFDESLEVHVRLGINPGKTEQQVRGSVILPQATGKTKKIIAFTSQAEKAKQAGAAIAGGAELIEEIRKTEKTDFDVAVAEPALMKDLAKIARILGPRGLMPTPKAGTVSDDIEKAVKELAGGKINFKNDDSGNIHQLVGKVSQDKEKLIENIKSFLEAVRKNKPGGVKGEFIKNITLCSTMGPGIRVAL